MLRFVPKGAVKGIDGGRPTSRGLPPAALGDGATEESPVPQKGIPKGLIPWAGAGRARRSPCGIAWETGRAEGAEIGILSAQKGCSGVARIPASDIPRPPARLPAVPDGQSALTFCSLPRQTKTRRATLKRFCPAGANSVAPAHLQRPLPLRGKAASLNARFRRRQAPAREPAAVCSDCRPIRNEAQRARPLLVGRARVSMGPKALAAGTAGWAAGPLGRWAFGPLGLWAAGPLGRWAFGPLGLWARVAPCSCGARNRRAALKTLVCRLFFPLYAVLPVSSVQEHTNRTASAFPLPLLRGRNDRTGGGK